MQMSHSAVNVGGGFKTYKLFHPGIEELKDRARKNV